ncbi:MAG: hypothetical protein P9L99_16555 [Candidatus Lernaella stagnicola]|nr:hypothetical protein [Candidatus Lernaella stagnicola]
MGVRTELVLHVEDQQLELKAPVLSQLDPLLGAFEGLQLAEVAQQVAREFASEDESASVLAISRLIDLMSRRPAALGQFVSAMLWHPTNRDKLGTGADFAAFKQKVCDQTELTELIALVQAIATDEELLAGIVGQVQTLEATQPAEQARVEERP